MANQNFRRRALFILPSLALVAFLLHLYASPHFLVDHTVGGLPISSPTAGNTAGKHDSDASLADNEGPVRNYLIASDYNFTDDKPAWLTAPPPRPLVLRIGIISQPKEYARRQAFRETTLRGVPKNEVVIHYRFLIGYSGEGDEDRRVLEEHLEYGDIIRLDMKESGLRLGEKRWRMLKWASQAPRSTYDYYLSADTDAFFRLGALARRLPYLRPDLDSPQTQDIFIGRMGFHKLHFKSNPYDNETTFENEDELLELGQYPGEEWYPYPLGYGVMISSHLVDRLTSPEIVLPHHVHYPSDDVVVGQWVADFAPSSTIVDDHDGFHDAIKHSWWADHNKAVGYDSVCVHHVSVSEMQELRDRKEFVGEWE